MRHDGRKDRKLERKERGTCPTISEIVLSVTVLPVPYISTVL